MLHYRSGDIGHYYHSMNPSGIQHQLYVGTARGFAPLLEHGDVLLCGHESGKESSLWFSSRDPLSDV